MFISFLEDIFGVEQAFYVAGYSCLYPDYRRYGWTKCKDVKLLTAGENDELATKERLKKIKNKCPQTEIFIVRNCGHRPHFPNEEGEPANEKMPAFLSGQQNQCGFKSICQSRSGKNNERLKSQLL